MNDNVWVALFSFDVGHSSVLCLERGLFIESIRGDIWMTT